MYGVICFIRITVVFAAGMVSLTIGQNCPDDYSRVEPYNSENVYYNSKEGNYYFFNVKILHFLQVVNGH